MKQILLILPSTESIGRLDLENLDILENIKIGNTIETLESAGQLEIVSHSGTNYVFKGIKKDETIELSTFKTLATTILKLKTGKVKLGGDNTFYPHQKVMKIIEEISDEDEI